MIDREASSLRYRFRHNRIGYICGAAAITALACAGIYYGVFYTGWIGIPRTQYLYYVDRGLFLENSWIETEDGRYYTDRNAKLARGLYTIDGDRYLFGEDGKIQKGWVDTEEGRMYMTRSGKALTGWGHLSTKCYYFGEDGVMQTGWLTVDGQTYYMDKDGVRTDGWAEIDGKKYYFGKDGVMCTEWEPIDGDWYLFAETGEMLTGDREVKGSLYHMKDDGKMLTGWYETDGGRRYHDDSGAAVKGWREIDGERYYFDDDHLVRSGRFTIGDDEFYLEEDGTVSPGWHESEDEDEEDFYVCSDGYILDTDKDTGNFGRLVIRTCRIDVAVYTAKEREDYQKITDEEDSAVAIKERRDDEYVIADRRSQGFNLDNVEEGTLACLIKPDGEIEEYLCSRELIGTYSGDDVTDDEDVSIWRQNEGGFCTYANAGTDNKEEVKIAFWERHELEEEEEED